MKAVAKKPARKAKTAALAPVDYVVPAGKVLVLRTCLADMRSPSCDAHGFIWPRSGPVECADWQPTKACGNGLHGVLWGEGDGGNPWVWDDTGVWLIVEVDASDVIELGGKVKFPRGVVVFSGPRLEATTMLGRLAPGRAIVGGTATAGDSGTATAGYRGTATAGDSGTATAGDSGTATAGDSGTATAGYRGTAPGTAGPRPPGTDSGTATAGDRYRRGQRDRDRRGQRGSADPPVGFEGRAIPDARRVDRGERDQSRRRVPAQRRGRVRGGQVMNWLPPQLMKVSALVLPGDIKARQKQPHVVELAESIGKRTGKRPIHLPTVEYPSKELLSGADRMAAQLILGYRSVWVQPVSQLTPQERRDIVRDENLHRRVVDRDVLIRQRVEEAAAEIEAARLLEEVERKPGRPKSAKGEAREVVARQLGTTPDAIRVAEARAVAAHVHAWVAVEDDGDGESHACACGATKGTDPITGKPFRPDELPNKYSDTPRPRLSVETYGLPLVTDFEADQLTAVLEAFGEADVALRRAQAALGKVGAILIFASDAQRLVAQVHAAAAEVRAARPAAVCPFCKRLERFIVACSGCKGTGFVAADVMLGVADELKLGGEQAQVVALGGRMVNYAYALTGKVAGAPAKAAPKAKKIRIENARGEELVPAGEETTDDGLPF
jgi:hypothetical protein